MPNNPRHAPQVLKDAGRKIFDGKGLTKRKSVATLNGHLIYACGLAKVGHFRLYPADKTEPAPFFPLLRLFLRVKILHRVISFYFSYTQTEAAIQKVEHLH